jgi:hypothetical protein
MMIDMVQKEFKTNRWLWAIATAAISLPIGLSNLPGKGYPRYPFGTLVDMFKGHLDVETVLNGTILPLLVVLFTIPFGWVVQAVLLVLWNTVTRNRISHN